ncbi:MAG: hypothetical protein ACRDI2_15975 [Chloroflexota bacterium]
MQIMIEAPRAGHGRQQTGSEWRPPRLPPAPAPDTLPAPAPLPVVLPAVLRAPHDEQLMEEVKRLREEVHRLREELKRLQTRLAESGAAAGRPPVLRPNMCAGKGMPRPPDTLPLPVPHERTC